MPREHSGSEEAVEWQVTGSSVEIEQLLGALSRLSETAIGHSISEAIREHGTTVRFGQVEDTAVAYFDSQSNEIVIGNGLQAASLEILAAHLAHEGTHVQWNTENSVEQEYHAFRAQAEVWSELKGDQVDEQCDLVRGMIALGEKDAKTIIRYHYPNLPAHA